MLNVVEFPAAGVFEALLTVYMHFAVARALLQYADADFYNPVSRFIDRVTIFPIRILRMFVPRVRGSDLLSPAVLILICAVAEQYLEHQVIRPFVLSVLGAARTVEVVADFVTMVILAHVVLSWVAQGKMFVMARLVHTVSHLLLSPFRRFIPPLGSIDFSPLVALIAISIVASTIHSVLIGLIS